MATRVEIVSGSLRGSMIDNAASETTLQEILEALRKMGGGPGGGGSSTGSASAGTSPNVLSASFGAFNSALKTTSSLLAQGNSSMASYSKGLGEAAKQLPGVGMAFGKLIDVVVTSIEILEGWNKVLKNLSSSGASFNNSILDMRLAAADARMGLEEFAGIVKANAAGFSTLGGTVTNGAKVFSKMSGELMQPGGLGQQLLEMGMSVESINAGLASYLTTTMKGTKVTGDDTAKMTVLYADYASTLDRISKIHGEEKTALEAKMKVVQQDAQWQLKMSGASPEVQAKMTKMLAQAEELYGPKGSQALKEYYLTGQVLTKDSRQMASLFPEMEQGFKKGISAAKNQNISVAEHEKILAQRRQIELVSADKRLKDASGALAAGAAGMGGQAGELASVASHMTKNVASYNTKSGQLNAKQVADREEAAKKEQKSREGLTSVLDSFNIGMKNLNGVIMSQFITGLDKVVKSFGLTNEGVTKAFSMATEFIEDNFMPIFESGASILSVFFEGFSYGIGIIADGWKQLLELISSIDVFGVSLGDLVKFIGTLFLDITANADTLKLGLTVLAGGFSMLLSQLKVFGYKLLDMIPGVDKSKEIRESENELNQKIQANQMARDDLSAKMEQNREAREEARAKKQEERDNKAAQRSKAKEATAPATATSVPAEPVKAVPVGEMQKQLIAELKSKGITDPKAIANVMAQVQAESGFKPRSEELGKYSAKNLFNMYGAGNKAGNKVRFNSIEEAQALVEKGPEAVGNVLYGGRMGNAADEGHKYRGRGLIQLTGKDNYAKYGKMIGVDLVKNPDLANDPTVAAKLAAAYFSEKEKKGVNLTDINAVGKAVGYAGGAAETAKRATLAAGFQHQVGTQASPSIPAAEPSKPKMREDFKDIIARREGFALTPTVQPLPSGGQLADESKDPIINGKRKSEWMKEKADRERRADAEEKSSETAGPKAKDATLKDVVDVINQLNSSMGKMIAQADEIGSKTARTIKSTNNSNLYAA